MVLGTFSIEPGKGDVRAYRFYVHAGKADTVVAERLWNDYAAPPRV